MSDLKETLLTALSGWRFQLIKLNHCIICLPSLSREGKGLKGESTAPKNLTLTVM